MNNETHDAEMGASRFLRDALAAATGGVLSAVVIGAALVRWSDWRSVILPVLGAAFVVTAMRYWIVLGYGAHPIGSAERARYHRLRTGLRRGGEVGRQYERMLRGVLDKVDRLCGDKGQSGPKWLTRLVGLQSPVPLWTARSYDRCLLVALLYPIATIYFFWVVSGHVGPTEAALGLSPEPAVWRAVFFVCIAAMGFVWFRAADGASELAWIASASRYLPAFGFVCVAGGVGVMVGAGSVTAAGIGAAIVMTLAGAIATARAGTLAAFATAIIGGGSVTVAGALAGFTTMGSGGTASIFGAIAIAAASFIAGTRGEGLRRYLSRMPRGLGLAALIGTATLFLVVMVAPVWIAQFSTWEIGGPISLYLALLTLVNGPFDWLTLGLTRALLRGGLERGGWYPLLLGIIDLAVAAVVVVLLAIAALLATQLYGHFTVLGGANPVLEVKALLEALDDPHQRTDQQYWWIYAMLFATLIPSIVNISLGSLSLIRGIPKLSVYLSRKMPSRDSVIISDRFGIVLLLTLQLILSLTSGILIMLGTMWVVVMVVLPYAGIDLITFLQSVAAKDMPAQLLRLLQVG